MYTDYRYPWVETTLEDLLIGVEKEKERLKAKDKAKLAEKEQKCYEEKNHKKALKWLELGVNEG